jgi:UDP-N-acetylmuramoyl-tripeptide--D-alanyl-D-alanine ligase
LTPLDWAVLAAAVVSIGIGGMRWLRIAQREHYLPGSVSAFTLRWWLSAPGDITLLIVGLFALAASPVSGFGGLAVAVVVAIGPLGLGLRGRTSPLAWTRRLRTVAAITAVEVGVVVSLGVAFDVAKWLLPLAAAGGPLLVDLGLAIDAPLEHRLGLRYVRQASSRLAEVAPTLLAVTGSYGKTSVKRYVAHLLRARFSVHASPKSYNNLLGLARSVNEGLAPGTEVMVAEMGTWGPGEIAEMCRWFPPKISAISAIGPVHLQRFGSLEVTLSSKSEITEPAEVVVLNVDDVRLAGLADRLSAAGRQVRRVSAVRRDVDVALIPEEPGQAKLVVHGEERATVPLGVPGPTNVAIAVAMALELGLEVDEVRERLASLEVPENRLARSVTPAGVVVLDDTYNSNPVGAATALEALRRAAVPGGKRVVVTPGMIELGPLQAEENRKFGAAIREVATHVIIVGRTNRRALLAGLGVRRPASVDGFLGDGLEPVMPALVETGVGDEPASSGVEVMVAAVREDAVAWVRTHLGQGDVVLYENDLPDHYP